MRTCSRASKTQCSVLKSINVINNQEFPELKLCSPVCHCNSEKSASHKEHQRRTWEKEWELLFMSDLKHAIVRKFISIIFKPLAMQGCAVFCIFFFAATHLCISGELLQIYIIAKSCSWDVLQTNRADVRHHKHTHKSNNYCVVSEV